MGLAVAEPLVDGGALCPVQVTFPAAPKGSSVTVFTDGHLGPKEVSGFSRSPGQGAAEAGETQSLCVLPHSSDHPNKLGEQCAFM